MSSRWLLVTITLLMLVPQPGAALHAVGPTPEAPQLPTTADLAEDPETGYVEIDETIAGTTDRLDQGIASFNQHIADLYERKDRAPVTEPIPLLDDPITPGARHGGLGDWRATDAFERIQLDSAANWTWRFGDADGTYPADADALLLSPRIDLDTLGELTDLVPAWRSHQDHVRTLTTAESPPPDLVTLTIDHRFSLAARPEAGIGLDGARVELFTEPTDPEAYREPGHVLEPLDGTTGYTANVQGFQGPAFSGHANWTTSAFDLTPWLGHTVRLGFRVHTLAFEAPGAYFTADRFEHDGPHGWTIDNATVRSVALPDRVKVEPFHRPNSYDEDTGLVTVPPTQPVDASARVVNLGARERTLDTRFLIADDRDRPDATQLAEGRSRITLAPGEVHTLDPDAWDPSRFGTGIVWFGAMASPPEGDTAPAPLEPPGEAWLPVRIQRQANLTAELSITPLAGTVNEPRNVTAHITNNGNTATRATAHLELRDDDHDLVEAPWSSPPTFQEQAVPIDPGETRALTWTVTPREEGRFHVRVNTTSASPRVLDGGVFAQRGPAPLPMAPASTEPGGCSTNDAWTCASTHDAPALSEDGWVWRAGGRAINMRAALVGTLDNATTPPVDEARAQDWRPRLPLGLLDDGRVIPEGGPETEHAPYAGYRNLTLEVRYRIHNEGDTVEPGDAPIQVVLTDAGARLPGLARLSGGLGVEPIAAETVHVDVPFPPPGPSTDSAGLDARLTEAWRTLEIDLSTRIREATGLSNSWNLGLDRLALSAPGAGDLLLDHVTLTGIPADEPEAGEQILLHTAGDTSDDVGRWTNELATRNACTTREALCWERAQLQDASTNWRTVEGEHGAYWRWGIDPDNPGERLPREDERLITPPIRLENTTEPQLVLDHRMATTADTFSRFSFDQNSFVIPTVYNVEVQVRDEDGTWSPFHLLTPERGFPTPQLTTPLGEPRWLHDQVQPRNTFLPGDGFYWPKGTLSYLDETASFEITATQDDPLERRDVFHLAATDDDVGPPVDLAGKTVRFAFRAMDAGCTNTNAGCEPTGGGDPVDEHVFWELRNALVRTGPTLGHDVRVANATLDPSFRLDRLDRLGPDQTVPIQVEVENTGRFGQPEVDVELVQHTDGRERVVASAAARIQAGDTWIHRFAWTVPDTARIEDVRLTVRATTDEPYEDQDTSDNTLPVGPHENGRYVIESLALVRADTRVSPSGGSADTVHALDTRVFARGNVPVEEVEVGRTIWRLGATPIVVREDTWTIDQLNATREERSIGDPRVNARHASQPEGAIASQWLPGQPGTYRVDTRIEAERDGDPIEPWATSSTIEVLEPVFQDGFEPPGRQGARIGGVPGTTWQSTGDWHHRADEGFASPSSWWVGGGQDGYPFNESAQLVSPEIDLTAAKSAVLTLATTYDTEPFYDGGRIELTPDDGRTWVPLEPASGSELGYASDLNPANPVHEAPGGSELVGGVTGTVPSQDATPGGWTQLSFPLTQVDALTRPETLSDLRPPAPDSGELTRSGATFSRSSWQLGTGQDAQRFRVHNGTVAQPTPREGSIMWYSGATMDRDIPADTNLTLTIQTPNALEADEGLMLSFADWRPGVVHEDREGTGGHFEIHVSGPAGLQTDQAPATPRDDGWTDRRVYLNATQPIAQGVPIEIRLRYWTDAHATPIDDHPEDLRTSRTVGDNRGWAVDDVRLHPVSPSGNVGSGQPIGEGDPGWSVSEPNPEITDPPTWTRTSTGAHTPGGWTAQQTGEGGLRWELAPSDGTNRLPANLDARLQTPTVDLRGVVAEDVSMTLRHAYNFQLRDHDYVEEQGSSLVEGGAIEIQVYNETTRRFDAWRTLHPEPVDPSQLTLRAPNTDSDQYSQCPQGSLTEPIPPCMAYDLDDVLLDEQLRDAVGYDVAVNYLNPPFEHKELEFQWIDTSNLFNDTRPFTFLYSGDSGGTRTDTFNLSHLVGQRFRLGLHAWANPAPATTAEPEGWTVRDMRIESEVFEGRPIRLRANFGSDGSVRGTGWGIDDVTVGAVTYGRHLQLELDEDTIPDKLQPGDSFWVNGTVKNRGLAARGGFGVRADTTSGPDILRTPDPERARHDDLPGDQLAALPVVSEAMSLGPAGSGAANTSFSLPIHAPSNAPHADLNVTVRLVELGPQLPREGRPLSDEVQGTKQSTFQLTLANATRMDAGLTLEPGRASPGDPVQITARIVNNGTLELIPRAWINITDEAGRTVRSQDLGRQALPANVGPRTFEATFTPETAGNLTVRLVAVNGTMRASATELLQVNRSRSILSTGWETASAWSAFERTNAEHPAERCTNVRAQDGQTRSASAPAWTHDPAAARFGTHGALWGISADSQGTAPGFQDAVLVGPVLDLRELENPALTLTHRPRFAPGHGGIVEIQPLDPTTGEPAYQGSEEDNCRTNLPRVPNPEGWFLLIPEDGYDGRTVSTPGSQADGGQAARLSPLGDGHPVFTDPGEGWTTSRFNLTTQDLETSATEDPVDLTEHLVRLRLRATTRSSLELTQGWDIDNLVLSDDGLTLTPNQADIGITDGARKTLEVRVDNPGGLPNVYDIEMAETGTTIPEGWVELLTRRVEVPPGESRAARVQVTVPISEDNQAAEHSLTLVARSAWDASIVDAATYRLNVVPSLHPNLVTRILSTDEQAQVGTPKVLSANILNTGLTESPPTTARFWLEGPGLEDRRVIDEVPVPPIAPSRGGAPGSAQVVTEFSVPTDLLGSYRFGVDVDPRQHLIEYDEADNRDVTGLDIVPLQRPDLALGAGDLRVFDLAGSEIVQAQPGSLLQIQATVRNDGNQPARNVEVTLSVGADPAGQRTIPSLQPGQAKTLLFTQFAPSNNTQLILQAKTLAVELDDANNEVRAPLRVSTPSFAVSTDPATPALTPARPASVTLELRNTGSEPAIVRPSIDDPGIQATFEPGQTLVRPGATTAFELALEARPTAEPGEHTIGLAIERIDAPGSSRLELDARIRSHTAFELAAPSLSPEPGTHELPITLRNTGNAPLGLELSIQTPDGWPRFSSSRHNLNPDQLASRTLALTVPNATQPGTYHVTITASTDEGIERTTRVPISVQPVAQGRVDTTPARVGQHPVVHDLELENTGNVPARMVFSLVREPPGWTGQVDHPTRVVDPGERIQGTLTFTPDAPDETPVTQFLGRLRLAPTESVPQANLTELYVGTLNARAPDLSIGETEQSPRFDVAAGQRVTYTVEVHNTGEGPASPVEVGLYRNELLEDLGSIPLLGPGRTATINLTFTAEQGSQSVVVDIDPHRRLVETDREDNAVGQLLTASEAGFSLRDLPSPGWAAAAAVLAGLALARVRRGREPS